MKQPNVPSASSAHNESERRSQLLQEQPGVVGAQWAVDACADARSNGRSIEGGWPGTVPEARMRVLRALTQELSQGRHAPLSHAELVTATSAAYERAKREWSLASKSRRAKPAPLAAAVARKDGWQAR
ncbi:MAG TPA: hypothetical protein VEQ58_10580 [Polyangiaceae bacterium]|nr:hypothetical protein [Polyangiaceae bacterium]